MEQPVNGTAPMVVPVPLPAPTRDSSNMQSLGRALNARVKQVC